MKKEVYQVLPKGFGYVFAKVNRERIVLYYRVLHIPSNGLVEYRKGQTMHICKLAGGQSMRNGILQQIVKLHNTRAHYVRFPPDQGFI